MKKTVLFSLFVNLVVIAAMTWRAQGFLEKHDTTVAALCYLPLIIILPMTGALIWITRRNDQFKKRALTTTGTVTEAVKAQNNQIRLTVEYTRFDGTRTTTTKLISGNPRALPQPGRTAKVWYEAASDHAMVELSRA